MITHMYIDLLTQDSVHVRKQNFIEVDGIDYQIGDIWRRAYSNTATGRVQVQEEVPEPYLTAIMAVWGDAPTVTDIAE